MRGRVVMALGMVAVAGLVALGALVARQPKWAPSMSDPCPIRLSKDMLAPGVHAIGMASSNVGWVVGEAGLIFRLSDGKWTHTCSPSSRDLTAVAAVSPDDAWAVGTWGTILHYRGGWTQVATPTQADLRAIAMVSPEEGWAAGGNDDAILLHYSGGAWSLVEIPIPAYLNGIAMVSRNEGWAVGVEHPTQPKSPNPMRSVILHYAAGAWTRVASTGCPYLSAVAMASATDGWALGQDASGQVCILHFTGGHWVRTSPADASAGHLSGIGNMAMTAPDDGWAADGGLLHYTAAGWSGVTAAGLSNVIGVAALSRTDVWAISLFTVSHYDGTTWTCTTLGIPHSSP